MVLRRNADAPPDDPPPSYESSTSGPVEDTPRAEPEPDATEFVKKTTGSITGTYYLRDSLTLETTAGSINVIIIPVEAKKGGQEAAYFTAKASAGSIHVNFPANNVPDRNYYTNIEASAGSIQGIYPTGASAKFLARAGSINIALLNTSSTARSDIFTEANAGATHLKFIAPLTGTPITDLHGTHRSAAGYIGVRYPASWEGSISAKTVSGRVSVDGQGVRIDKSSDGLIGGQIEATKGNGRGIIEATGNAGGIHVTIGEN